MNNETITISKTTAETILYHLTDYLYYIDGLDKETRAQIIALDELIAVLDYENEHRDKVKQIEDSNRRMNEELAARRAGAGD
jgi:hypothetical protein